MRYIIYIILTLVLLSGCKKSESENPEPSKIVYMDFQTPSEFCNYNIKLNDKDVILPVYVKKHDRMVITICNPFTFHYSYVIYLNEEICTDNKSNDRNERITIEF